MMKQYEIFELQLEGVSGITHLDQPGKEGIAVLAKRVW